MELTEVIKEIDSIRTTIYKGKLWQDGEVISQVIVKLGLLNSYLGDQVAQLQLDAATLESHYKSTKEKRKLELMDKEKISATAAESQAFVETDEIKDVWNKAFYNFKQIQVKREDTNGLIDTLRSRLSYMKSDREALK